MAGNRASRGLLVSALGAAVLAVSVFLPWYSISITPSGAAAAQQQLASVAQQYGNPTLQSMADQFGSVAGRPLATVSAHQALQDVGKLLLLLAGVALLASLLSLGDVVDVSGGQIALVGSLATLFVVFRMVSPPGTEGGLVSLSLGWGSWTALLSAAAIVGGGLWASSGRRSESSPYESLEDLRRAA